jgi:hypothetical protein
MENAVRVVIGLFLFHEASHNGCSVSLSLFRYRVWDGALFHPPIMPNLLVISLV